MKTILVLFSLICSGFSYSATLDDVTLKDSMMIADKNLVLNGIATRKATWLRVKVYVGGLYLEKKSSNFNEFVNFKGPKHITMHFVRDVSKEKMIGGWKEAFENAFKGKEKSFSKIKPYAQAFYKVQADMEKGQVMDFSFTDKGVIAKIKGKAVGTIGNKEFADGLLSVWFVNPGDEQLSLGLLGKN